MDEVTVTYKMTLLDLEFIDALVVAAIETLDEQITKLRRDAEQFEGWDLSENEDTHRLMRARYAAIGRSLDLLRDPMAMVPA